MARKQQITARPRLPLPQILVWGGVAFDTERISKRLVFADIPGSLAGWVDLVRTPGGVWVYRLDYLALERTETEGTRGVANVITTTPVLRGGCEIRPMVLAAFQWAAHHRPDPEGKYLRAFNIAREATLR